MAGRYGWNPGDRPRDLPPLVSRGRINEPSRLMEKALQDSGARTQTSGLIRDLDERFLIELLEKRLRVFDELGNLRAIFGQLGSGPQDYGLTVFTKDGEPILSADGLGAFALLDAQLGLPYTTLPGLWLSPGLGSQAGAVNDLDLIQGKMLLSVFSVSSTQVFDQVQVTAHSSNGTGATSLKHLVVYECNPDTLFPETRLFKGSPLVMSGPGPFSNTGLNIELEPGRLYGAGVAHAAGGIGVLTLQTNIGVMPTLGSTAEGTPIGGIISDDGDAPAVWLGGNPTYVVERPRIALRRAVA